MMFTKTINKINNYKNSNYNNNILLNNIINKKIINNYYYKRTFLKTQKTTFHSFQQNSNQSFTNFQTFPIFSSFSTCIQKNIYFKPQILSQKTFFSFANRKNVLSKPFQFSPSSFSNSFIGGKKFYSTRRLKYPPAEFVERFVNEPSEKKYLINLII